MADIGRSVPHHGSGGLIVPRVSYPITLTEDQHLSMLDEIASAGLVEVAMRDKRIAELQGRAERLRVALGWFVADERFHVAVGGNPNAVEPMIAEARRIYENA